MNNKLIAIVGVGSIGSRHVDTLLRMGYDNLVGVDSRPIKDEARLPIVSALEELDYFKPTHALICTPPEWHYHHAKFFIDRGIPTFVEKPMAMISTEAHELLAVAQMNKSIIGVGYMERAHPIVLSAKEYAKDCGITSGYLTCHWRATPKTYELDVVKESSHAIDTAQFVFGSIMAVKVRSRQATRCDLRLTCGEGIDVSVVMNMDADPLRKISVYAENDLYASTYGNDAGEWDACYQKELQAFLDGKPLCSGEEGLRVVEILEATK